MPTTVPNQSVIHIHKSSPATPFLQISINDFYNAYKNLNATACCLYLYLVANQNGYCFAYSPKALENQLGMPRSTAGDQWDKLVEKGYLVPRKEGSNTFDFYDKPKKDNKETKDSPLHIDNVPKESTSETKSGDPKFVF